MPTLARGFSQNVLYDGSSATLPLDYQLLNFDIMGSSGHGFDRERFNIFFDDEPDLAFRIYDQSKVTTSTYEVRDYFGNIVTAGNVSDVLQTRTTAAPMSVVPEPAAKQFLILDSLPPGWYRLFIRRAAPLVGTRGGYDLSAWGLAQGGCMFVVWRRSAGKFHAMKTAVAEWSFSYAGDDMPLRSLMLGGVERLSIDNAANPLGTGYKMLGTVQQDIDLAQEWYLPFDADRPKSLFINFPNYNNLVGENEGVAEVVTATSADVQNYEARNEPDGQGAAAWLPKQAAFYAAVKGAEPTANVMGPCPTGIMGGTASGVYRFLADFLAGGGANYIDKLSFHDYTQCADLPLYRFCFDRLESLLAQHDLSDIEKWMTEWGAQTVYGGIFFPILQARFQMLAFQVWEQYGLPKERVNLFYDMSHGFFDVPTWGWIWEQTFYPIVSLMRVWSEELYGKNFAQRYGFGVVDETWTIGSRFEAEDGSGVAAFSSAGRTDQTLTLNVTGAPSTLTVVTPFGVESSEPVVDGVLSLPIQNCIPTYVRLPVGVALHPVAGGYGADLARGKAVETSGSLGMTSKLTDGQMRSIFEHAEYINSPEAPLWDDADLPCTYTLNLGSVTTVDTIVVVAMPPYGVQGGIPRDFDIDYWNGFSWVTLETIDEPANNVFDASDQLMAASQVETYYSQRHVFVAEFGPVATTKVRLLVRDYVVSVMPHDTIVFGDAEPDLKVQLRAIQVYNRSGLPSPKYGARVA